MIKQQSLLTINEKNKISKIYIKNNNKNFESISQCEIFIAKINCQNYFQKI